MKRKKKRKKIGLPPGTIEHNDNKRKSISSIKATTYSENEIISKKLTSFNEIKNFEQKKCTFIELINTNHHELSANLHSLWNIHSLTIEDICNGNQRIKLESFSEYSFLVIRHLFYDNSNKTLQSIQINIVIIRDTIILIYDNPGGKSLFTNIYDRLEKKFGNIRYMASDYLLYTILDTIVDYYFSLVESLEDYIDLCEEELLEVAEKSTLERINTLRKDILEIKRWVWPVRQLIISFETHSGSIIEESTTIFFRDVRDHLIYIIESLSTNREILNGMIDIYLSQTSNKLNEVMKVLTIISTIFIPLTFIAGIYGMNFHHMPEIYSPIAYPIVLGVMGVIALIMIIFFKKKKWF